MMVGACLLFWAALAAPARWLWGDGALVLSAVALALCLVPSTISLVWGQWALRQSGGQQMLMVLGGTGLRMASVLGLAIVLYVSVPYLRERGGEGFWAWVLVYYALTLILEMVLLVGWRGRDGAEQGGPA
jgi:hypothetical protein